VLLGPVTIVLGFFLARRLFGAGAGVAAALVLAVYPFAWQYEVRLFSESLAVPLTIGVLLAVLDRRPTRRVVAATGLLLGAALLVRPSSLFLLPGVLVAWVVATGWRRGLTTTAAATGIAVLCVAPWTVRNAVVGDGFVPISIQSAALYCTFNDLAAGNEVFPYACQILTPGALEVLQTPRSDVAFADALQEQALDYIADNPLSVPQAFFWNGLSRLWMCAIPRARWTRCPSRGAPRR
jgi:4-amino-4-deoxy-L-arabinose transferase-like glycosyltransferase